MYFHNTRHLKQGIPRQPLLLAHSPVDGDGGEVLLDQQLGKGHASLDRLDEDHHLGRNNQKNEMAGIFLVMQYLVSLSSMGDEL